MSAGRGENGRRGSVATIGCLPGPPSPDHRGPRSSSPPVPPPAPLPLPPLSGDPCDASNRVGRLLSTLFSPLPARLVPWGCVLFIPHFSKPFQAFSLLSVAVLPSERCLVECEYLGGGFRWFFCRPRLGVRGSDRWCWGTW